MLKLKRKKLRIKSNSLRTKPNKIKVKSKLKKRKNFIKSFKIKLSCHTKKILHLYTEYLKINFRRNKCKASVVKLPTKTKRITLLKSVFVHKEAKKQYETKISKACIIVSKKINRSLLTKLIINKPKSVLMTISTI